MSALTEIAVQWEKGDNTGNGSSAAKMLLTTSEAAAVLGIGRTSLYELIRSGKLDTIKIGRRRLIPATAIPKLITTLIEESEDP
ncbi:DNA-binding protein [Parafrankia sp. BMG5.11]|nr:DNA-binding protein [Parafrankia sp. BMG5.11]